MRGGEGWSKGVTSSPRHCLPRRALQRGKMINKSISIAIIGAGMGGMAVAGTLRKAGFGNVRVFEQASRFARIGAGIQMMPNSMKVLRGIGVEERLRKVAFAPDSHLNRDGYTGEVT